MTHSCNRLSAFAVLCVAVCVLGHMSFKFIFTIRMCTLPRALPVSADACYERNQTKRTDNKIERGKMTFPAELQAFVKTIKS